MKKTALFILILFTMVRILPTIQYLSGIEQSIVLNLADEETGEKDDTKSGKADSKINKEYVSINGNDVDCSVIGLNRIHLPEKLLSYPNYKKLTPPPDFY